MPGTNEQETRSPSAVHITTKHGNSSVIDQNGLVLSAAVMHQVRTLLKYRKFKTAYQSNILYMLEFVVAGGNRIY